MIQQRQGWSDHEVQQIKEAVGKHGHTAASIRSILVDAQFPGLKPPVVTLQRLQDKIKSLEKQNVPWLSGSTIGPTEQADADTPEANPCANNRVVSRPIAVDHGGTAFGHPFDHV